MAGTGRTINQLQIKEKAGDREKSASLDERVDDTEQVTVLGPQNAGGPQNVGLHEKLKIKPDMPYLGEKSIATASLDMIYGI